MLCVNGYQLFVNGYWLLGTEGPVIGYLLFVNGYWLIVIGEVLVVIGYRL